MVHLPLAPGEVTVVCECYSCGGAQEIQFAPYVSTTVNVGGGSGWMDVNHTIGWRDERRIAAWSPQWETDGRLDGYGMGKERKVMWRSSGGG